MEITHTYHGLGEQYAKIREGSPEFVRFMVEKSGLFELAKQLPEQPIYIVEFGVGSGQQTIHLEDELEKSEINNYRILALDKSFNPDSGGCQLNILKHRIRHGRISQSVLPVQYDFDGKELPIPSEKIDLSYMPLVLHHLTYKAEIMGEIARISRQGARLFIYGAALEDLKDHPLNEFFPKYEFDARRCPTYKEIKKLFKKDIKST